MATDFSQDEEAILRQWQQINEQYPNDVLTRIREKIPLVKQVDSELDLFGADSHEYELNPVIALADIEKWQKRTGATLPQDFVQFLTQIGNGGLGPYYGIVRFEDSESRFDQTAALPSILSPDMSEEEWQKLTFLDDDCSDEEFDERENYIHQGVFYLGTCGCEYDLLLVISGEYAGRIIYTNHWCGSNQPFFFSYELSFSQWYERWLDEVIQGYETSWFGHRLGGNEQILLSLYSQANSDVKHIDVLNGLTKLPRLSNDGALFLESIIKNGNSELSQKALSVLAKFSFNVSKLYLMNALKSEDRELNKLAVQSIFWYQKDQFTCYQSLILSRLKQTDCADFVSFSGYILKELNDVKVESFQHLFCHNNPDITVAALYAAAADTQLASKINQYFPAMISDNPQVALIAVQSFIRTETMTAEGIAYLEMAWQKYPKEKDEYIRNNIIRFVKKFAIEGNFT
ncbi:MULTISPECIES: SMI1/KNR4 family protein [Providencia]|uniref:SMI1/KNR4 family protein n=1 Tax=Providencia TaxID=586 RepID=UPI001C5B6931|nr:MULTISPECIES: SMI1/KNR4 family protein [Providencia]QXX83972.1 SMI1/KNR4 family protein [Providencia sp. R33]